MATDSYPSRGGPKTAIGQARASQNAIKHGLLAKAPVLVTEDRADFTAFTTALIDQMAPVGPYEELLAARVAEAAWRLRRIGPLEVELFTYERERIRTESNGAAFACLAGRNDAFTKLARYEAAIERVMFRSRAELLEAQRLREIDSDPISAMFRLPAPLGQEAKSAS